LPPTDCPGGGRGVTFGAQKKGVKKIDMEPTVQSEKSLPGPVPERFNESYPAPLLALRALFGLAEAIMAVYIIFELYSIFAYFYASYLAIAITIILPLARCTRCFYYGKVCHICWGKVASFLYPKGREELFKENFKYSVFLYPVWMIPLLIGLVQLARLRSLKALLIFVIYLAILFISRRFLQWHAGCKRCHQRLFCPGAASFRRKKGYLAPDLAGEGFVN
jgi:hypothetical protein